ncbi:hypothetical protein [Treponema pectinovorum]|uniref:hypothetical protein n=1 Tax=Treponema pectinovorum TaxID=164 RepID=UPI0011CB2DD5|nr:hypothetical protein [Treponema pectinovorum]
MKSLYKIRLFELSKIFLSLLIITINIREPFFHTREIFFALFLCTSFIYADYSNIGNSLLLLSIWGISITYNLIVPGSNIDFSRGIFETVIASCYLYLTCFNTKKYASCIIKSYMFVAILIALITIVLWIICISSKIYYAALKTYFDTLLEKKNLMICSIDNRNILGKFFVTVYYRTAPCMIGALGYSLICRLKGLKKNTFTIVILAFSLFVSGARANMMCACLLIFLYVFFYLIKHKKFVTAFMLITVLLFMAIYFAILFFTDSNSASTGIKVRDMTSYSAVFDSDPIRFTFFGWGKGSTFFSLGRYKDVDITELSHLETIRRYGLISTISIFVFIWLKPAIKKMFFEKNIYKYFYILSLLGYVVTACTNPFLIDSVGFCALLFFLTFFKYGETIYD